MKKPTLLGEEIEPGGSISPAGVGRVVRAVAAFEELARLAGAQSQREGPFVARNLTADDVRGWIPQLATMSAAQRAGLRGGIMLRHLETTAYSAVALPLVPVLEQAR